MLEWIVMRTTSALFVENNGYISHPQVLLVLKKEK
jgi:hypothetical protein